MFWFVLELIVIISGIILYFLSPINRVASMLVILIAFIGLAMSIRNYFDNKKSSELYAQVKENSERINALERDKIDLTIKEVTPSIVKYGGAVSIDLSINGIPKGGSYLFDYGDKANLDRNRVSLFVEEGGILNMTLYDDASEKYTISTSITIGQGKFHEIVAMWNKEYGEILLFVDEVMRGRVRVKSLNVELITGELTLGANLNGGYHAFVLLREIGVYSFKK